MASRLEKIANIFLIVACTVVVGEYGYRYIHQSQGGHAVFASGSQIHGTSALDLSSAPRTLIIETSSTCPYCLASMPFYKRVVDTARKSGTKIVAVCGESPAVNQAYLTSHGIFAERVLSQAESGLQVSLVPTVALVRRDGKVIGSWTGLADKTFELAATKAIQTD